MASASNFQVHLASIQEASRVSLDSSGPNAELLCRFWLDQLEAGASPGPSVRADALESQLLPLWPGRPGKKRVVHYLGFQQKP